MQRVQRALAGLEDDDQDLLLWSYRDGLDALEIGDRLRITPGAVHVRRHRALARLAERLGVTLGSKREHL